MCMILDLNYKLDYLYLLYTLLCDSTSWYQYPGPQGNLAHSLAMQS